MKKPKAIKVPRTRNAGTMTEAQFWGMIRACFRKLSQRWIPMKKCKEAARRPNQSDNPRLKWEYRCAACKTWFPEKGIIETTTKKGKIKRRKGSLIQVDHIIPCGGLTAYSDVGTFLERMLKEETESFQILCRPCHQIKTNDERG